MNSVLLKSSDGLIVKVEEATAKLSQTLSFMIEDGCSNAEIPLLNVDGKTLVKVIEYCKKHVTSSKNKDDVDTEMKEISDDSNKFKDDLESWDDDYISIDQATLYDVIMAANYLNIKGLLDLACRQVAHMIKGKSPEEIRKLLNIKYDFMPGEEEEIRRENQWAFE